MNQKKLAFVAHEFGFFNGHGGIASYLHSIAQYILENHPEILVYVLTNMWNKKSPLLKHKNMHIKRIRGSETVTKELLQINPDYVEVTDYLGWCADCMIKKRMGLAFQNTVFAVMHHTAGRECAVWATQMPLKFQPMKVRKDFMRENAQIQLADIQLAPCAFMAKYVKQNYGILDDVFVFAHHNALTPQTKQEIRSAVSKTTDLTPYENTFNIFFISRIEGRKNQSYLVQEFIKFIDETHADARLFLVGNDGYNRTLGANNREILFSEIPIKYRNKIIIFDFINQEQQKSLAAIGDVCVLPSFYENFSIAVVEALLRGAPLIATKNSGTADYIQSEWTFDPFVPGALCEKLIEFHETNAAERERIHGEQLKKYLQISDPHGTIDARLNLFDKFESESKRINDWNVIDFNKWNDDVANFTGRNFILCTNKLNSSEALQFARTFRMTYNLQDKIIVLNKNYGVLDNLKDCVNRGLPIILQNVQIDEFDETRPICENLLDYALKRQNKIIELAVGNIHIQSEKRNHKLCIYKT